MRQQRRQGFLDWLLGAALARIQRSTEAERATDVLISEAQRQIVLQYQTADGHDIKTIGMIAASLAAAAFVASTRQSWRIVWGLPIWWLPVVLLGVGIGALVMSLWQQSFQRGPKVPEMYRTFSGTMMEAKGQLLRELVEAIEHNRSLLPPKSRWYAAGCWFLALAGASATVAWAIS